MMFDKVAEFHRAFGVLVADHPALPDRATRDLRIRLLAEELDELLGAEDDANAVEIADALADISYIVAGTVVSYGLTLRARLALPSRTMARTPTASATEISEALIERMMDIFDEYEIAEDDNDIEAILAALVTMLVLAESVAALRGYHLPAVFEEVHASNMSKLGEDGLPILREDGKVLKGPHFFRPDIARVLAEQKLLLAMAGTV